MDTVPSALNDIDVIQLIGLRPILTDVALSGLFNRYLKS
jgi:hypothetical protein